MAVAGIQHGLTGVLDSACILGGESILVRQAPVRPQCEIVAIFEIDDLANQFVAKGGGGLGRENRFGLSRFVDRTVGSLRSVGALGWSAGA